jgi:hypothetical protein
MKWVFTYSAICIAAIGGVLAVMWASSGFSTGGLSGHGIAAIVLGVTVTVVLGVVLMALVFYSDRSGRDRQVHRSDDDPWQ